MGVDEPNTPSVLVIVSRMTVDAHENRVLPEVHR